MLNEMGLNAKPKIVEGGVYFQTIGNQKTKAQTGFANWFQDFPHPENFMFLMDGKSIQDTNNQNFGNTDDPEVNKWIAKLDGAGDHHEVADKWRDLNKQLVERAWIVHTVTASSRVLLGADRLRQLLEVPAGLERRLTSSCLK